MGQADLHNTDRPFGIGTGTAREREDGSIDLTRGSTDNPL
jgi:hypothetical protein